MSEQRFPYGLDKKFAALVLDFSKRQGDLAVFMFICCISVSFLFFKGTDLFIL